jgi:hypothetical protein
LKKFRFWLPIFAFTICLFNLFGFDDKNLLLFFTSPHLMLLEDFSSYIRNIGNEFTQMIIWYILNIIGWFLIGWIIDILISKIKNR